MRHPLIGAASAALLLSASATALFAQDAPPAGNVDVCGELVRFVETRGAAQPPSPVAVEDARNFQRANDATGCRDGFVRIRDAGIELPATVATMIDAPAQAAQGQPPAAEGQPAPAEGGANIVVQQPAPAVTVEQAPPQVTVSQPQPQVTVAQPQPEIIVNQPAPVVTVDIPQPEIIVRMPEPQVNVSQAPPQVEVVQPAPQVQVVQQEQPQVQVQESAQANVQVQQPQGQPAVQVQQPEGQPQITYNRAEPQVRVNQAEGQPTVRMERLGQAEGQPAAGQQQAAAQPAQPGAEPAQPGAEPDGQAEGMAQGQPVQGQGAPAANVPDEGQQPADRLASNQPSGEQTTSVGNPAAGQIPVSDIQGMSVVDSRGEQIGEAESLVLAAADNKRYVVIDQGGFLGLGEKRVALSLEGLMLQGDQIMVPTLTEEQIRALPDFQESDQFTEVTEGETAQFRVMQQ